VTDRQKEVGREEGRIGQSPIVSRKVHSHLVVSFNNLSRHFAYWLTSAAFFFGWARMGNGQSGQLPQTMRRIVLVEPNKELAQARLEVQEAPVPTPASGEVLIRVSAAPGKILLLVLAWLDFLI
jgi:hypothetical protein